MRPFFICLAAFAALLLWLPPKLARPWLSYMQGLSAALDPMFSIVSAKTDFSPEFEMAPAHERTVVEHWPRRGSGQSNSGKPVPRCA
jgi:hypothetical protein